MLREKFSQKVVSAIAIWTLVSCGLIGLMITTPDDQIKASATTLYVGGSGPVNYTTIQASIDLPSRKYN